MIEFEGFELVSPEQAILDKESRVRPQIIDNLMKAFGAKEGSSRTETRTKLSEEQQRGLRSSISGLEGDIGPGAYTGPGRSVDDLEGYRATDARQLGKLQSEQRLSIQGVEQLRNQQAQAAMQVRPDIAALRGVANQASMPYDARLRETTRQATEALGRAEIGDVRSRAGTGTLYGSARELAKRTMGENYARTVGEAAARAVEESNLQRMQLGMQGAQAAGQLGLSMQDQRARAAQQMGQLEIQGLGLTQQDLASRRQLGEQSKQFGASMGLDMTRQSLAESQQQNLYNMQTAQMRLDRLKSLGDISTRQTKENIVHKKPGSAGLLPGLISAGGMVAGAAMGNPMLGAQIGGAVGGGLAQGYTGDGSFQGQGLAQMGAMAMGSGQQPGGYAGLDQQPNIADLSTRPTGPGWWAREMPTWLGGESYGNLAFQDAQTSYNQQLYDQRRAQELARLRNFGSAQQGVQ